jgi:hypothetical protein
VEFMENKTPAELKKMVDELVESIPADTRATFEKEHAAAISSEYHVTLLMYPNLSNQYTVATLRRLAFLLVWSKHNGGDGWRRPPRSPKPLPLSPSTRDVRSLEPA